jgi:hypothetical protein
VCLRVISDTNERARGQQKYRNKSRPTTRFSDKGSRLPGTGTVVLYSTCKRLENSYSTINPHRGKPGQAHINRPDPERRTRHGQGHGDEDTQGRYQVTHDPVPIRGDSEEAAPSDAANPTL